MARPLQVSTVLEALEADAQLIDVRQPQHFVLAHIRHAINIPYSKHGFAERVEQALPEAQDLIICADTETIACEAATVLIESNETLAVLGCVQGMGVDAWKTQAFEICSLPYLSVEELNQRQSDFIIIDAREPEEFVSAHLPKAFLIPWHEAWESVHKVPLDQDIAVICATEMRSTVVASMLQHQNRRAFLVRGGMFEWIDKGFIVEQGLPT